MFFKKSLTSVCVAIFLSLCMVQKVNAGAGTHNVVDRPANNLLSKILVQQLADVSIKLADLNTFIDMLTSMGDPEQLLSALDLEKALGSSIASVGDIPGITGNIPSIGGDFGLGSGNALSTMGSVVGTATDVINGEGVKTSDIMKTTGSLASSAGSALGNEWAAVGLAGTALTVAGNAYGLVEDGSGDLTGALQNGADKADKAISDMKSSVKSGINKATKVIGNISIPAQLQDIGFAGAVKSSGQMANLIEDELLPPIENGAVDGKILTDEEKTERQKKRIALRDAAVADAYALAIAMQYEGSSVQEGTLASAKSRVDSAETLQERAAASLDVGLARISQLIRGNEISAMSLRLLAAEAIASMPRDYEL